MGMSSSVEDELASTSVEDELASTSSVDLSSPNRSFVGDESVMHHENQLLKRLNELSSSVILIIIFPTVLNILYGLRTKNNSNVLQNWTSQKDSLTRCS